MLVREATASIECPPEFIGVPMLAALGAAIGNSRTIKLKEGRADPRRGVMGIGPESNTGKIRHRRPRRVGQVAYLRSTGGVFSRSPRVIG